MAKDPAMLFYTADFLIGVMFLDMAERGQYITLLCLQQQKGHLTLSEIQKVVGDVSPAVLEKFITDEDGRYYNARAEVEINKRNAFVNSRIKSGNTPKQTKSVCEAYACHTHKRMENENDIEIENSKDKKEYRGAGEEGRKEKRFRKPTVEEVAAYCRERNNGVDPQAFIDFYESKGWMVGKSPMKDWKASVRTWEPKHPKGESRYRGKPLSEAGQKIKENAPNYAALSWELVKNTVGGNG